MNVRFGSKADIAAPLDDVRFAPESRHQHDAPSCLLWAINGHRQSLLNNLVRASDNRWRHRDAEYLCGLEIDDQVKFSRLRNWQFGGAFTLENPAGICAGHVDGITQTPRELKLTGTAPKKFKRQAR